MLVDEMDVLGSHVEIEDANELAVHILTEYCRQHFEESTKAVAKMFKCPHCG